MTKKTRQLDKLGYTFVHTLKYDDPANPSDSKKAKNKHSDGGGMYLLVKPNGSRHWHMDYTRPVSKKRNTLAFGIYPTVTITKARDRRNEARRLLDSGIDPAEHREEIKQLKRNEHINTFEVLARECLAMRALEGKKDGEFLRRLEHDVLPYIGNKPITKFTTIMLEDEVTKRIAGRNALSVVDKVRKDLVKIFDLAKDRSIISDNPAEKITIPKYTEGNFNAITEPDVDLVKMLRDIWDYENRIGINICTAFALRLSVLTFLRPTEIRSLKWSSFKRDSKRLEVETLKTDNRTNTYNHIVPLSRQSIELLERLYLITGSSDYVFYSPIGKEPYLSENTVNDALKRMGYRGKQTAHGFRATAATILNEVLGFHPDWINAQLAHVVKDQNDNSYFRVKYLKQRVKMMQVWADYIDDLLNGTSFVPVVSYEDDEKE